MSQVSPAAGGRTLLGPLRSGHTWLSCCGAEDGWFGRDSVCFALAVPHAGLAGTQSGSVGGAIIQV